MNLVHQQAGLDSSLKTTIELAPKKYFFGEKKNLKILKGTFQIKNTGDKPFKIIPIAIMLFRTKPLLYFKSNTKPTSILSPAAISALL